MVDSSLKKRFLQGGKGGAADRVSPGFKSYNLNLMVGGKKSGIVSLFQLLNSKKEFLIAVFANLITQLGITYYVMMNYQASDVDKKQIVNSSMYWMCVVATLIIILILAFVSMPSWMKFILFCVFSLCWGIILSFLKLTVDSHAIQMAILGTMSIFGVMFLFGAFLLTFGIALGYAFSAFLFLSLLLLILTQIVMSLSGGYSMFHKAAALIGLILFSLYIIYDTNAILQRNYYGDFITASIDYYLDILNIFLDLLSFNNH